MTLNQKEIGVGMTKQEIYKKIEPLKTFQGKLQYLTSFEKKIWVLHSQTKQSLYAILAHLSEHEKSMNAAAKYYWMAGNSRKANKLRIALHGDSKEWHYEIVAKHYEKSGNREKAKKFWIKAGDFCIDKNDAVSAIKYYKKSWLSKEDILERPAYMEVEREQYEKAAEYYEKIGQKDKAKEVLVKRWDTFVWHNNLAWAEKIYTIANISEKEKFIRYGNVFLEKHNFRRAAEYYEKASEKTLVQKMFLSHIDMVFTEWFSDNEIKEIYEDALKKGSILIGEKNKAESYLCRGKQRLENYCKKAGLSDYAAFEKIWDGFAYMANKRSNWDMYHGASIQLNSSLLYQLAAEYYEKAGKKNKVKSMRLTVVQYEFKHEYRQREIIFNFCKKAGLTDYQSLKKIGDTYLAKWDIHSAVFCYEKIWLMRDKKILEKIGDAYLISVKRGKWYWIDDHLKAAEYYQKAEAKNKETKVYLDLGDWELIDPRRWKFENAAKYYEKAGIITEEEKYERSGDIVLSKNPYTAIEYYKKFGFDQSNDPKKLEKIAHAYELHGKSDKAMNIYRRIKNLQTI